MNITSLKGILGFCVLPLLLALSAAGQQREQQLKQNVRALYSSNDAARSDAASRLVEAGPEAIPLLITVLCNRAEPNFDVAWRPAAEILGKLRAGEAAPCLVQMLGLGDVTLSVFKPERIIAEHEPAFAALVQIGEPAVPAIARALPSLHPDKAYLAMRVLRVINTPHARAAAETYIKQLENQARLAREVLEDFKYGPGLTR